MKFFQRNSEHAVKVLSNVTLMLSNLYTLISNYDAVDLTCPDYEILQLKKAPGGLVFSEEQLFKLTLIMMKKLAMMVEITEQRKKRYKLFKRRSDLSSNFGKAFGNAILAMARLKNTKPKEVLSKHAYKSHFTPKNSDANLNSLVTNKISEMISSYAQIETQKVVRGSLKAIKNSKTLQNLLLPKEAEQDEESITQQQKRIKQNLRELTQTPRPKGKDFLETPRTNPKDWKLSLKRELKSMDSEIQTLASSTHRAYRSIDAVSSRLSFNSKIFDFKTPRAKKTSLPELGNKSSTPKPKTQLKYSLSIVSHFLPQKSHI